MSFIQEAIDASNTMLVDSQIPDGVTPPLPTNLFQVTGRYIFGYSAGAMMGYRLIAEQPDAWAAMWAMSGSIGGKAHKNFNFPVVDHLPTGIKSCSLFAHHGVMDTTVPPGPPSATLLQDSSDSTFFYGLNSPANSTAAEDLTQQFQPLSEASRAFRAHNLLGDIATVTTANLDVTGLLTSTQRVFPPGVVNGANPQVVIYRDPIMRHDDFISLGNRYFDARTVWNFFAAHRRVTL